MPKFFVSLGLFNAAIVICIGAFGAHFLKSRMDKDLLDILEVGVRYHMYHALGLILMGLIMKQWGYQTLLQWSAIFLIIGMVLFSGSLYALALTGIRRLGMITPFGGIFLIMGWVCAAYAIVTSK